MYSRSQSRYSLTRMISSALRSRLLFPLDRTLARVAFGGHVQTPGQIRTSLQGGSFAVLRKSARAAMKPQSESGGDEESLWPVVVLRCRQNQSVHPDTVLEPPPAGGPVRQFRAGHGSLQPKMAVASRIYVPTTDWSTPSSPITKIFGSAITLLTK